MRETTMRKEREERDPRERVKAKKKGRNGKGCLQRNKGSEENMGGESEGEVCICEV